MIKGYNVCSVEGVNVVLVIDSLECFGIGFVWRICSVVSYEVVMRICVLFSRDRISMWL